MERESVTVAPEPGGEPAGDSVEEQDHSACLYSVAVSTPEPGGGPTTDPVEEQKRYQRALDLLSEGRFENAAIAFGEFLDAFPLSRYRDDATFWMGECLYALRRFESALGEFRKLVENHPDSSMVPGARLKIGFILHELGCPEEAEKELKSLVGSTSGTIEAELALDRLLE